MNQVLPDIGAPITRRPSPRSVLRWLPLVLFLV
jgi:hypothetical protein